MYTVIAVVSLIACVSAHGWSDGMNGMDWNNMNTGNAMNMVCGGTANNASLITRYEIIILITLTLLTVLENKIDQRLCQSICPFR